MSTDSRNVMKRLVLKDLYLYRMFVIAALVLGIPSALVTPTGSFAFGIGGMFYLTTIIAFGVILVMHAVVGERKDKSMLFSLSLPISPLQYTATKLISTFLGFAIPWFVLSVTAGIVILLSRLPDGMLSYLTVIALFMLANFSIVLGIGLRTGNDLVMGVVIVSTNLCVSLFFMGMGTDAGVQSIIKGEAIVFNPLMIWVLVGELLVIPIALSVPFWFRKSKGDVL